MTSQKSIRMRFGLRLKELRAERGISQDAFAHSIGMARSYYAEVEIGKRNIALENIDKIAQGFGITPAELFDSAFFKDDAHKKPARKSKPKVDTAMVEL